MKIEEMRKIADERTKGKWEITGPSSDDPRYTGINVDDKFLIMTRIDYQDSGVAIDDGKFIALAANTYDALLDIAEASKAITNIYYKFNSTMSLKEFWSLMQEYCDEYGLLKMRIRTLDEL